MSEKNRDLVGVLAEAIIKAEKEIDRDKVSKQKKVLNNYMFQGHILQSLKKGSLSENGKGQMLFWSDGTPISETHERLRVELGFNKKV